MTSDRTYLQALVNALPDSEVPVAISFLAELADQEIIDAETAAKLDQALAEPGEDLSLEELRKRLGL
jgi:cell division inhibitor SulA